VSPTNTTDEKKGRVGGERFSQSREEEVAKKRGLVPPPRWVGLSTIKRREMRESDVKGGGGEVTKSEELPCQKGRHTRDCEGEKLVFRLFGNVLLRRKRTIETGHFLDAGKVDNPNGLSRREPTLVARGGLSVHTIKEARQGATRKIKSDEPRGI